MDNFLKKTLFFTILGFCFTLPLKESWNSIFLILLFTQSILLFARRTKDYINHIKQKLKSKYALLALVFLLISILSFFLNYQEQQIQFNRFSFAFLFLLFLILFKSKIITQTPIKTKITALFFGLSISGFLRVFLGLYNTLVLKTPYFFSRIEIPFEDFISTTPIVYGVMLNFCWLSYLVLYFKKQLRFKVVLAVVVLVMLFQATYFSLIGLGVFVLITLLAIIFFRKKRIYKTTVLSVYLLSIIGFIFLLTNIGHKTLVNIDGDPSRFRNYNTSIELIKKSPWIGYGVGNELSTLQKNREKKVWERIKKYNAHNQYFEFLLGGGVLLFIVFLSLIGLSLKDAFKTDNVILTMFVLIISFTMYVESVLAVHKGFVFVSYFWTYLIYTDNDKKNKAFGYSF